MLHLVFTKMKSFILFICLSVVIISVTTQSNHDNEHTRKHSHHNVHTSNRHAHKAHQPKHHTAKHPFHQTNRDAPQKYCHYVCSSVPPSSNTSSSTSLQIIYNGEKSLITIFNSAANVALIIDYSSNIVIFFNGQSATTLVLDESSNQLYRLSANSGSNPASANLIWQPSKQSFDAYFQQLTPAKVQELLKLAQQSGEKVDPAASPDLDQAVSNLGASLSSQEALKLINSFTASLRGSLKPLFGSSGAFTTPHGLRWIISVSTSAADLLEFAQGGLGAATSGLNPEVLFKSSSGVEGLVKLLGQIGEHVNLAEAFAHLWMSPDRVAQLLGQASTGSHNGLDGLISILISIWETIRGQEPITAVITNVLNYNAGSEGEETSLADLAKEALEVFEAQYRRYRNPIFNWYISVLRSAIDNNLVFNGVNVSDIIKILTAPNPLDRISTVVRILALFNPVRAIPQFFKFVVGLLNDTNGAGLLSRLIPGVDLSNFTGPGTIFQNILHGQDFSQIIANPWNATQVLSRIPVLGPIFERFSQYIGNGFNLNNFLNGSSIVGELQNIVPGLGSNSSFGNVISSFTNATSSIPSQIEHGIEGILGGIGGAASGQGQSSSNQSSGQTGGLSGGADGGQGETSSNLPSSGVTGSPLGGAGGGASGQGQASSNPLSSGQTGSSSGGASGGASGQGQTSSNLPSLGSLLGGAGGEASGQGQSSSNPLSSGQSGSSLGGAGGGASGQGQSSSNLSSSGQAGLSLGGADGGASGQGQSSSNPLSPGQSGSLLGGAGGELSGQGQYSSSSGQAGGLPGGAGGGLSGQGQSSSSGQTGGLSGGSGNCSVGHGQESSNSSASGSLGAGGKGLIESAAGANGGGSSGAGGKGSFEFPAGAAGGGSSGVGGKGSIESPAGALGGGSLGAGGKESFEFPAGAAGGGSAGFGGKESIEFPAGAAGGGSSGGHVGFSDKKVAKAHHHKTEEKRKHVKKTVE